MRKILKFLLGVSLSICLIFTLSACGNNNETSVNWLSPMISATMTEKELDIYATQEYLDARVEPTEQNPNPKNHVSARVAYLNTNNVSAAALVQNGAKKVTLSLEYSGNETYKVHFGYRIDLVEAEENDDHEVIMGHGTSEYGAFNHVDVLYNVNGTWFNNTYGSTAESGGELIFGEGYYGQTDPKYSATRRAIPLNKDTVSSFASLDFYVVGLEDGFYVLNLYVEREDDAVGHFHGLQVLAMTTLVITVGEPGVHEGGHGHEH